MRSSKDKREVELREARAQRDDLVRELGDLQRKFMESEKLGYWEVREGKVLGKALSKGIASLNSTSRLSLELLIR